MRPLAIVPTYNERDNLLLLIPALLALQPPVDVLVVDDNSPDGTGQIAEAMAARDERVRVLHRAGKQGLGRAYIAGFQSALALGYDCVIQMGADLSHRPEDLPRRRPPLDPAEVGLGSRRCPGGKVLGWSAARRFISRGGSLYARWLLGL